MAACEVALQATFTSSPALATTRSSSGLAMTFVSRFPVTPAEAVLGAKIEVPTIEGSAFLKVPPATSSGKVFRVRERGVLNPGSERKGDQFVEVRIVVPEIPDEATKELMREYSKLNSESPREHLLEEV